jgi:hypothetical protein
VNGPPELYYPSNPDEHYPPDNIFLEITGVLDIVTGYFLALLTYRLIRDRQQRDRPPLMSWGALKRFSPRALTRP